MFANRNRRRCVLQRRRYFAIQQIRISKISPFFASACLRQMLTRTLPMEVTTLRAYGVKADTYALCPNCGFAMEREYQNSCDYCGQRLGWTRFSQGHIVIEYIRKPCAIPQQKAEASSTCLVKL